MSKESYMSGNLPGAMMQGRGKLANEFNLKDFLLRHVYLLPWILIAVGVFTGYVYLKLRYIVPIHAASGKVLIKTDKPVGSSAVNDKLGDVVATTVNSRVMDDQIELIRSTAMGRLVVKNTDLQHSYYYKGNFKNQLIYNPQSPIQLKIISLKDSNAAFSFRISVLDNFTFKLNESGNPIQFGVLFQAGPGSFVLEKHINDFGNLKEYICGWTPELQLAKQFAGGIQAAAVTKGANVLNFVYYSPNPKIAEEVVNGFLKAYQDYTLQDKRESSNSALAFIDEQLDAAKWDLGMVEGNLQQFKEDNKVVELENQATGAFGSLQESGQQIKEQAVKVKLIEYLIGYVKEPKNINRSIPLTTGVNESSVAGIITEYNKMLLQRDIALQSVPKENPMIKDMELSMGRIRNEILLSLGQLKDAYASALQGMQKAEMDALGELRSMPKKQKQLLDITRQQKVMEELYSTLLQRKIQTSISSASTLSNIQILEPGNSWGPVSPVPGSMYTTAILLGIVIPIGLGFLLELLNDKITGRDDIVKHSDIPILSEVGHSDEGSSLIVSLKDRKYISEQFRILRTNIKYLTPHQDKSTILVTSSISGEGKTFVSTNISAVLAISGKKVVVLEFDIRKPKLLKGLHVDSRGQRGITNYLMGTATIDEIIMPYEGISNLFIIPCGPIPPNPSELVVDKSVDALFHELKQRFDHVVIDTAPVGLVSDGFELGKHADVTVYIARHHYTLKRQLDFIDDLYKNKRLPHMSIVVNDVRKVRGYGGNYGYTGYGYSGYYGYKRKNYYSSYFDADNNRPWWKRLLNRK